MGIMVYEVILDTILYVCFFNWLFEDNAYVFAGYWQYILSDREEY